MTVEISAVELLALKKLAVVSHALATALSDDGARQEQLALTRVLTDICARAAQ